MTLIIDASVALKWFLTNEPEADQALAIIGSGTRLIAPEFLIAEVCNAAWKSARLGRITQTQANEIAISLPGFFDTLVHASTLAERAVVIAGQLDHPVYDALYLALAEREQAMLVTADSRLRGKVRGTVWESHVVILADYKIRA